MANYLLNLLHMVRHAVVEELARLGATVHTCARTESVLNECLQQWKMKGFKVTGSVCDVTSETERQQLMSTVSSQFDGKLNILVSHPLLTSLAETS